MELEDPAACSVPPICSPGSTVFALLSVAPKSICPIHDPARPPAIPAKRGLRCRNEGCLSGAGWAVGACCGPVVAGFGVADC